MTTVVNPPPPPHVMSSRIPLELQAVFLASNRGEEVDVAPETGVAFRMFRRKRAAFTTNTYATASSTQLHVVGGKGSSSSSNQPRKNKKSSFVRGSTKTIKSLLPFLSSSSTSKKREVDTATNLGAIEPNSCTTTSATGYGECDATNILKPQQQTMINHQHQRQSRSHTGSTMDSTPSRPVVRRSLRQLDNNVPPSSPDCTRDTDLNELTDYDLDEINELKMNGEIEDMDSVEGDGGIEQQRKKGGLKQRLNVFHKLIHKNKKNHIPQRKNIRNTVVLADARVIATSMLPDSNNETLLYTTGSSILPTTTKLNSDKKYQQDGIRHTVSAIEDVSIDEIIRKGIGGTGQSQILQKQPYNSDSLKKPLLPRNPVDVDMVSIDDTADNDHDLNISPLSLVSVEKKANFSDKIAKMKMNMKPINLDHDNDDVNPNVVNTTATKQHNNRKKNLDDNNENGRAVITDDESSLGEFRKHNAVDAGQECLPDNAATATKPRKLDKAKSVRKKKVKRKTSSDEISTTKEKDPMNEDNNSCTDFSNPVNNGMVIDTNHKILSKVEKTKKKKDGSKSKTSKVTVSAEPTTLRTISVSPQVYLDSLISFRGYSTERYNTLETAYHNEATPLQEASYTTYIVNLAKAKDGRKLSQILQSGLSPNPSNYYGESLMHLVCRTGSVDMLQIMLDCGATVQVSDDFGRTPLHDACWAVNSNFEVIDVLLRTDAHLLYMEDNRGATPLAYVRKEHWIEWINFIDDRKELYWPIQNGVKVGPGFVGGKVEPPILTTLPANSRRIPDPPNALSMELARMVAMGQLEPDEALILQNGDDDSEDSDTDSVGGISDGFGALTSNDSIKMEEDTYDNDDYMKGTVDHYDDDDETDTTDFDPDCDYGAKLKFISSRDSIYDDPSISISSGHDDNHSYMDEDEMEEMLLRIAMAKQMKKKMAKAVA